MLTAVASQAMRNASSRPERSSLCGRDLRPRPCRTTNPIDGEAAPDLPMAKPRVALRQMVNGRRLTILLWIYVAQALAGSVIGFAAPFLYYFGVL